MRVVINLSKTFPIVGNEMNCKSTIYGRKIHRGLICDNEYKTYTGPKQRFQSAKVLCSFT